MSLADEYRVLGLRTGADFSTVKAAYRRLVRRYHPDINPGNQRTKDKFIRVTQAYKRLAATQDLPTPPVSSATAQQEAPAPSSEPPVAESISAESQSSPAPEKRTPERPEESATAETPIAPEAELGLSEEEILKRRFYRKLKEYFKARRFPRAITLVEALAQKLPQDPEVRQWQAITYQRWGHHLLRQQHLEKAERYLRKAARTDPHNKALMKEIWQDLGHLRRLQQTNGPPISSQVAPSSSQVRH